MRNNKNYFVIDTEITTKQNVEQFLKWKKGNLHRKIFHKTIDILMLIMFLNGVILFLLEAFKL